MILYDGQPISSIFDTCIEVGNPPTQIRARRPRPAPVTLMFFIHVKNMPEIHGFGSALVIITRFTIHPVICEGGQRDLHMTSACHIFRIDSDGRLGELGVKKFEDERQMQNLIEYNLDVVFLGLEFLESEFGRLDGGEHRLDVIAFHRDEHTFSHRVQEHSKYRCDRSDRVIPNT